MDIKEFLLLNIGKWSSLRTTCHLAQEKSENNNSEIGIEILSHSAEEVIDLCQKNNTNPLPTLGAIKTSWDSSTTWGKPWAERGKAAEKGSNLLLLLGVQDNHQMGQFLQSNSYKPTSLVTGTYLIGQDDVLNLIVEEKNIYFQERIWFPYPNLRLRTSVFKSASGSTRTAFYSEIRKLPPKES